MKIRRFYNAFRKSLDLSRRARAAFEHHALACEACGHETPLAGLEPLTMLPCPECSFNNLVPAVLDDYMLFEPLGAGGVSSVYKALRRDTFTAQTMYAVKLLRADKAVDEQILDEFVYEAQVHHEVSPHPSIVRFIELGHTDGEHYHVMEFVPGESVKRRIETSGRIPEKTALRWTLELVGALQHILEKGYLYRDVSPGNLLIRGDQSICLIDFGLALSIEEADAGSDSELVAGTPEYMPPERVQRAGEDERSLVYSAGMLLVYMLKGEPLIKGGTHKRAALQHIASVRVAFNRNMLPPDVSTGVFEVIRGMIQYDPVDRPESLAVTAKLLQALLAS